MVSSRPKYPYFVYCNYPNPVLDEWGGALVEDVMADSIRTENLLVNI
ncbi:MAG: hypothetical protein IPM77_02675 [Crocinitomicaceae bacterium]|nr:hypothetical protein [Crocinitomicaceae bacterium]